MPEHPAASLKAASGIGRWVAAISAGLTRGQVGAKLRMKPVLRDVQVLASVTQSHG